MFSSKNLTKLVFLSLYVLAASYAVLAETDCDLPTEKRPDVCKHTETPVGHFNVTVSYNSETAYVGNSYVDLNVSIQSPDSRVLEIKTCESKEEPGIKCDREEGPTAANALGLWVTKYKYRVRIAPGVDPKPYPLTLTFNDDNREVSCEVRLYVGVTSNLKVRVETDLSQPPDVFTGIQNTLQVTLINDYANYPINVSSVSVKSDPYGGVTDETIPLAVKIEPGGQRKAVPVTFTARGMNFSTLIGGLGSSRLILNFAYDDGYGRQVTNLTQPVPVRIRPRDYVLVVAMLVGVFAGALIKFYLQRLQETGQITRRQVLGFVLATMGIGLVVAVIAMVGKIQIIAFDATGSYDKPLVIFAIALTGALGGAQILSMWLKKASGGK